MLEKTPRLALFVICLASILTFAVPQPWRPIHAADWNFLDEGEGNGDDGWIEDEGGYTGEASVPGDWSAWDTPPVPGDEGDDFGQTASPPGPPAKGGGLQPATGEYKGSWLYDKVLGTNFCLIITPGDWYVSGEAVWNLRTAVNPCTIAITMENPARKMTLTTVGVVAELEWVEAEVSGIRVGFNDGDVNTDTGVVMRPYRDAVATMREFIAPGILKGYPGVRPGAIGRTREHIEQYQDKARQRAQELTQSGNRITGIDAGGADLRFDWALPDGTPMEGKLQVFVHGVSYVGSMVPRTAWTIDALVISTWPKGGPTPESVLDSKTKVTTNPQWQAAAREVTVAIQSKNRRLLEQLGERSRQTFREAQEVRYQLDEKFRRALMQETEYAGPDGKTYIAPNTANHVYLNPVTGETLATEREIPVGDLPSGTVELQKTEPW